MPSPDTRTARGAAAVICDRAATAVALGFPELVEAIAEAAAEYSQGRIASPERLAVPLRGEGVLLSMPASGPDLGIHKLVTVQPANRGTPLPTLHGVVTVCDGATGRPLCFLDGPELTGRRTAAVSLLGMRTFLCEAPGTVLLVGTGVQARHHLAGLHAIYPRCRVLVRGRRRDDELAFCAAHGALHADLQPCPERIPDATQVVVTLTTSKEPVYDEPARADRLVIGVGAFRPDMAEIGATTLGGSTLYADDPAGARHEAGDLLRAGVDWARVQPLAAALGRPRPHGPVVLKSVGTAAWDLAASRVAVRALGLASSS